MKRILTVITMAILTLTAIGTAEARQQTDSRNSLAGKVSDAATSAPIEFATVALILPDSTFVDGTTTDSTGKFAFSGLTAREYILKISFIGYKDAVIRVNPADGTDIGTVSIEPDAEMLDAVVVSARRPVVRRRASPLTSTATSSSTAHL